MRGCILFLIVACECFYFCSLTTYFVFLEMTHAIPSPFSPFSFIPTINKHSSILASLATFKSLWVTRSDYLEHGASIVNKRTL